MDVSTTQLNTTAKHEGFSATQYKDGSTGSVQNYSIGYGHQIQVSERNTLTKVTKEQALVLLKKDMQNVVNYVNKNSKKTLNQNQFDALCDFGYNCGIGALASVITELNNYGHTACTTKISKYIYWRPVAGGEAVVNQTLVKRRAEEIATYNGKSGYTIIAVLLVMAVVAFAYIYIFNNGKIPYV